MDVFSKLKKLVEASGYTGEITLDTIPDDVGIDSLGLASLIFDIEEEFKIKISPENFSEIRKAHTFGDFCDMIEKSMK